MAKLDKVLMLALVLIFSGFVYVISDRFEQRIVETGDRAPDFAVQTQRGTKVSTRDFGGKLMVLNFWATWCPPCLEEMPSLNAFAQQLAPEGVVVLGISVDKNESSLKRFLAQNPLAFQVARDPEAEIPAEYGSFKWPETYVIDRSGKVVQKYVGPRNWSDPKLVNEIKALL